MPVAKIVRDNVVEFTVTFRDADGVAIDPDAATLTVNFRNPNDERENETIDMDPQTDGTWFASWESDVALPGRTYWSAKSSSPAAAEDGMFDLVANPANLATPES